MNEQVTKWVRIAGQVGGAMYVFVAVTCIELIWTHLGKPKQTDLQAMATWQASELAVFYGIIIAFVLGLVLYRFIALRQGWFVRWAWWAVLISGILLIPTGLISGRIVLTALGLSNMLHCYGTKEFLKG